MSVPATLTRTEAFHPLVSHLALSLSLYPIDIIWEGRKEGRKEGRRALRGSVEKYIVEDQRGISCWLRGRESGDSSFAPSCSFIFLAFSHHSSLHWRWKTRLTGREKWDNLTTLREHVNVQRFLIFQLSHLPVDRSQLCVTTVYSSGYYLVT